MSNLDKFLYTRKAQSGEKPTHTSFVGGSYYISKEDYKEFQKLYFDSLQNNEKLYLTERNSEKFKFYADVDFKEESLKRQVQKNDIKEIVKIYERVLFSQCIVSTRDSNIHLNFQKVVNKKEGLEIRSKIISEIKTNTSLNDLVEESDWDKVIDKAVYNNGGLRMIGSLKSKENSGFYKPYDIETGENYELTFDLFKNTCIRTDISKSNTQQDSIAIIQDNFDDGTSDDQYITKFIENNSLSLYHQKIIIKDIKYVSEKLVCVNINNTFCPFVFREHKRSENSSNSPLYIVINGGGVYLKCQDPDCNKKRHPENPLLLTERLKSILKIDENYEFMTQALYSPTHYDVSKFIFECYKDKYMIEGVKNGDEWYQYDGNRWVKGVDLWVNMSDDIVNRFTRLKDSENEKQNILIDKLIFQLKSVPFKGCLMKECSYIFHLSDKRFSSRLDENPNLMCFENGVLDLSNRNVEFRQGRKDDYLSLTTGINYIEYDENDKYTIEVEEFLDKVFVDKDLKDYAMKVISSCLFGGSDEHFHIWTGKGSNGKSTLVQLIEKCLGNYACKLPISLLTNKRASSSVASPELSRTKGKRFLSMQEPEAGDELKVGLLKELTGKDKIVARELYKNPIEFLPQFKLFLCVNDLPTVTADDNGTWRRLRVTEFKSRFSDNPVQGNKYDFKKDRTLLYKMENWREAFMSILVEYYKQVAQEGIVEPEQVMKYTNDYKKSNDVIETFIDSELTPNPDVFTSSTEVWGCYLNWCRECGVKAITKLEFNKKIKKNHKEIVNDRIRGFNLEINNSNFTEE